MKISILSIPLYYHSEENYYKYWETKFRKALLNTNREYSDDEINIRIESYSQHEPRFYRYNDILGYAELILDGNDILIYYHLNGDQRKIYNRHNPYRTNSRRIYQSKVYSWGGRFRKVNNKAIRDSIEHAFKEIENQCKLWKVCVQLENFRDRLNYFDYKKYLSDKNWIEKDLI